jgi:DNA-binding transcriptional regulator YbjK
MNPDTLEVIVKHVVDRLQQQGSSSASDEMAVIETTRALSASTLSNPEKAQLYEYYSQNRQQARTLPHEDPAFREEVFKHKLALLNNPVPAAAAQFLGWQVPFDIYCLFP